ncbi:23S rRNA (adenine(2503)-C(2))-methyltransferase RlmN [Patescibacteria group bacterium]|nr:23S rRNA (adenine(2503)-C(2))-methyltransferase RlmN [Patescibacteria group bacterium]
MDLEKLKFILEDEPAYRLNQARHAIFKDIISDWSENTTLSLALREKLNIECPLNIDAEVFDSSSSKSTKALITLEDGVKIETVLLHHVSGRNTVCVSSQVGCQMGCQFCATGQMGYVRNLTVSEIIEQVLFWERRLKDKNDSVGVNNVVFMGMGEPFMNYDNVLSAINIINSAVGFNIGVRHISVSTAGLIDGINKLSSEKLSINLAISLHATNDRLRSQLMPINNEYPIKKLMSAVDKYVQKKSRRVMFEYMMIEGVNDSREDAMELADLLAGEPLYMVNLIRYNSTGRYRPSSREVIAEFKNILMQRGINVTQRYSFGKDIKAACGQLAGRA